MGEVLRLPDSDRDGRSSMGVTLYLIASAVIFGGLVLLFAILRRQTHAWPPADAAPLPQFLPALATALGAAVSLTLHLSVRGLLSARLGRLQVRLSMSVFLATLFAAAGSALWVRLASEQHPNPSPLEGLVFLLLLLFGAHVIGGVILLAWLRRGVKQGRYHARNSTPVRLVARLWYFLTAAWSLIYVTIFLV